MKRRRPAAKGQNLVELAFSITALMAFIFAICTVGHAWRTVQAVTMAARSAVHTAAMYHSASVGTTDLHQRLVNAGIDPADIDYANTQIRATGPHNYGAVVRVFFVPLFNNDTLRMIDGTPVNFFGRFPITWSDAQPSAESGVY